LLIFPQGRDAFDLLDQRRPVEIDRLFGIANEDRNGCIEGPISAISLTLTPGIFIFMARF
jgi:hypothetical protein